MAAQMTIYLDTLSLITQHYEDPEASTLLQTLIRRSDRIIKSFTKIYSSENPDLLRVIRSHNLVREKMTLSLQKRKSEEIEESLAILKDLIAQADKWLESSGGERRAQVASALLKK